MDAASIMESKKSSGPDFFEAFKLDLYAPNNNFMKELINGLDLSYLKYIKELDRIKDTNLKNAFIQLLKIKDLDERKSKWEKLQVNINSIKQVPYLANPYFVGFGNPKAKVLFIGKEKGFDVYKAPKSFFNESVNNILQWQAINGNKQDFKDSFDPRNPRISYPDKIYLRHTWGKYAQIISGLYPKAKLNELLEDYTKTKHSLFDYCFMTEINHMPSKYSKGFRLNDERFKILQNQFYRSFEAIIIGAKGYLKQDQIKSLFQVNLDAKAYHLDYKGKNNSKEITCDIYKSDTQLIIYCQQLSGASGWTNEAIKQLIEIIKKDQIHETTLA
ncbi:hypothetical protein [Croceibacter atlanticus]|uniref:hypothetical protein n=1 Tax=Croceibacter atlanticus TaxID=313588 RepID=UPI0024B9A441|nr:hypothetical protein [Croceibacter atlanticus]